MRYRQFLQILKQTGATALFAKVGIKLSFCTRPLKHLLKCVSTHTWVQDLPFRQIRDQRESGAFVGGHLKVASPFLEWVWVTALWEIFSPNNVMTMQLQLWELFKKTFRNSFCGFYYRHMNSPFCFSQAWCQNTLNIKYQLGMKTHCECVCIGTWSVATE